MDCVLCELGARLGVRSCFHKRELHSLNPHFYNTFPNLMLVFFVEGISRSFIQRQECLLDCEVAGAFFRQSEVWSPVFGSPTWTVLPAAGCGVLIRKAESSYQIQSFLTKFLQPGELRHHNERQQLHV